MLLKILVSDKFLLRVQLLTPLGSLHFSKKFHTAPEDDGVVSLRLCFRRSAGAHVEAAMPLTTAIPSLIVVKSIPFC